MNCNKLCTNAEKQINIRKEKRIEERHLCRAELTLISTAIRYKIYLFIYQFIWSFTSLSSLYRSYHDR